MLRELQAGAWELQLLEAKLVFGEYGLKTKQSVNVVVFFCGFF